MRWSAGIRSTVTSFREQERNGMGTKIAHRLTKLLQGIIGLVVLAGLGWGLYTVLQRLTAHLTTLNPNVLASIIAATATVLVATVTVLLAKYFETRTLVFKEHRDKKVPIYEKLIKFFYDTMYQSKEGKTAHVEKILETRGLFFKALLYVQAVRLDPEKLRA